MPIDKDNRNLYYLDMRKETVIQYFGTQAATANALGIKQPSVACWPEIIPQGRAYQIQALTFNKLRVDPLLYVKSRAT